MSNGRSSRTAYHRQWWLDNRERAQGYRRKSALKRQEWFDALRCAPCIDCGGRFAPECMDFDHVRGKKEFGISRNLRGTLADVLAEIEKCDLICANCHRVRTRRRLHES